MGADFSPVLGRRAEDRPHGVFPLLWTELDDFQAAAASDALSALAEGYWLDSNVALPAYLTLPFQSAGPLEL
jgi:hypothetical protein